MTNHEGVTSSQEVKPKPVTRTAIASPAYVDGPAELAILDIPSTLDIRQAREAYSLCAGRILSRGEMVGSMDHETVQFSDWLLHHHGKRPWAPEGHPRKDSGIELVERWGINTYPISEDQLPDGVEAFMDFIKV